MSRRRTANSRAGRPRRRRGGVIAGIAALTVVALGCYAALDAVDAVPGVLTIEPTVDGAVPPKLTGEPPQSAELEPLRENAPIPTAISGIVERAFANPAFTGKLGAEIRDAATGRLLYSRDPRHGRTPASVTKVLTGAAALGALGPEHTFTTTARLVSSHGSRGEVAIVGGGDVMLGAGESQPGSISGRAGIATLARDAARSLRERGISEITLSADTARYSGPRFNSGWQPGDIGLGFITNIEPLMINTAARGSHPHAPRTPEPVPEVLAAAKKAFAAHGIAVRIDPNRSRAAGKGGAPGDPAVLASVDSAPVSSLVRHMMQMSDNIVAEVLGREVALARGKPGSAADAAAQVPKQLGQMNIDTGTIRLHDTSGLSYGNRISPHDLSDIITAAAQSDAELSQLIPAMPVGGLNGTLRLRYLDERTHRAAGAVTAKTGTLSSVASLAGTVRTADGRLLVFAIMTDGNRPGTVGGARQAMDAALSQLAGCGCR